MLQNSSIHNLFNSFSKQKVLVIGDVMTDAYLWGKVERISPEAPVPIVAVSKKESRLGGAANVALNIQALGAKPYLCGIVGNDSGATEFIDLMKKQGLPVTGILKLAGHKTTIKTRVIGNSHQLLRVDDERIVDLSKSESDKFSSLIVSLIEKVKPDVIIFEDYDKGALNELVISKVISEAASRKIKTTVDPKKKNFFLYKGVSLFKPNLNELKSGLKTEIDSINITSLKTIGDKFRKQQHIDMLMVTLSEHGVFYCTGNKAEIIPAHIRNISDVSGAGDTVISVASLCLASDLSADKISAIANLAGGLVCEKVGVVPIDKQQLINELVNLKLEI